MDVSFQRIRKERNGCAAINVANGAVSSVEANVKKAVTLWTNER
jgi:hypothetical protein